MRHMSTREMEERIGMSRSDATRDENPPMSRCPNCGSSDIDVDPEEKERGFTLHPAQGFCSECNESWDA